MGPYGGARTSRFRSRKRPVTLMCTRKYCESGFGRLRWIRTCFPDHGPINPDQLEIKRLRHEVSKLNAKRDIAKTSW